MKYEIDFLAVGEASKGGDAICFRFWDDDVPQFVGVIDGGMKATGQVIVDHIKKYYGTEVVDLVINTHPHADHTAGLTSVLEQLQVNLLMMHLPWEHSDDILELFHDGRITSNSLAERIKKGLQQTHDLYELSLEKEIPIVEPFSGADTSSDHVQVVGPGKDYYESLLPDFTATPQAASLAEAISQVALKTFNFIKEAFDEEKLTDPVEGTNSENNSSVITMLNMDGNLLLLTADAGVPALERAADLLDTFGVPLKSFTLVQIPHHGSKRNIGPTILNRVIGEIGEREANSFSAVASVPKAGEPKHPSRRVTNAFNRRGASVFGTKGQTICHHVNCEGREGWSPVTPVPQYEEVEEEE